jgi:hypothetical protein
MGYRNIMSQTRPHASNSGLVPLARRPLERQALALALGTNPNPNSNVLAPVAPVHGAPVPGATVPGVPVVLYQQQYVLPTAQL